MDQKKSLIETRMETVCLELYWRAFAATSLSGKTPVLNRPGSLYATMRKQQGWSPREFWSAISVGMSEGLYELLPAEKQWVIGRGDPRGVRYELKLTYFLQLTYAGADKARSLIRGAGNVAPLDE